MKLAPRYLQVKPLFTDYSFSWFYCKSL